ncbi:hypothetical protein CXB49_04535 [Chromobacterium sp. ATCC 53434]|nr:hypothetical protein CXB49_04535 [Chromobacterium sp. ATCC 53434]
MQGAENGSPQCRSLQETFDNAMRRQKAAPKGSPSQEVICRVVGLGLGITKAYALRLASGLLRWAALLAKRS